MTSDATGTVTVGTGVLDQITIRDGSGGSGSEVETLSLTTDETHALYMAGYDQDNNYIRDVNVQWTVQGDIGTISTGTSYSSTTIFTATTIGTGTVQADTLTFQDQTGIITVSGGALSYLLIRDEANGGGSAVGAVNMTTDESLILYAAGYDADNNYLSDVDANWSVTGSLDGIASSGTSVEFLPSTSSTSGTIVVSSTGVTSDATGTITVINPPIIWFVEGTLSPSIIYAGLDTSFSMTVSNVGDLSVTLNPSTNFTFSDGFETYTSVLIDSTYIEQSSNALLVFENQTVPNTLTPGQYTPYLNAIGFDEDGNNYNQAGIQIGSNPLSLAGFTINSIFCSNEQVWPGQDSILVTITVINHASQAADDLQVNIVFSDYESEFTQTRIDTVESIPPNQQATLIIFVEVSESLPPGNVQLDCSLTGSIGDLTIYETGANNTDSWDVLSFPELYIVEESFSPEHIAQGQDITFALRLNNIGTMGVSLDQSTQLQLFDGSDSIICYLNDEINITGSGQNTLLNFNTTTVPISFLEQSYEPILKTYGVMENGSNYTQQIDAIDTLTVYEKININIIEGTLEPDTIIQGQNSIFSVDVSSNALLDLIFNENETFLSVKINDNDYTTNLKGDSLLGVGGQAIVSYNAIEFPTETEIGDYQITFQFLGDTEPFEIPFLSYDTTGFGKLTVIGPPEVEYEYGLEPLNVVVGEMVEFKIYVQNNGMCSVELSTQSTLHFSDGVSSFYANLAAPVLVHANSVNYPILLEQTQVPAAFNFGNYLCYFNLIGTTTTGAPYSVFDMELDSLSIESGKGPAIMNIRYEDGGYMGIPDGIINKSDLIKVKFDEQLNYDIIDGKNALDYFMLISEGDRFGYTDSSIVIGPLTAGYNEPDRDSCLFVELGADPVLATNCASNRGTDNGQNGMQLKAEDSPSLVIINPNIGQDIIEGISMSDAGFLTNRPFLDNQLTQIDVPDNNDDYFSKYSILVEDLEKPVILNFYPDSTSKRVSPFSSLKGFVSGRNFMYINDLVEIISNYTFQGLDMNELITSPSEYLPQFLQAIISSSNEVQILSLVNELQSYQMVDNDDTSQIIINPLKQMYTNVKEPLFFTYSTSSDVPNEYSQPYNTELIFNNNFDNQSIEDSSSISNNFEIVNRDSLIDGTFAWFKINTVLQSNQKAISKSIAIDINNQYLSDNGYFIWSAPNPYNLKSNETMIIEYELKNNPSSLEIKMIDATGMLVREWNNSTIPKLKGRNRIPSGWNGRNGDQVRVSPGAYILVLYVGNAIRATWVVVAK